MLLSDTQRTSLMFCIDIGDNSAYGFSVGDILSHFALDLFNGMDDRGVVATTEQFTDVSE